MNLKATHRIVFLLFVGLSFAFSSYGQFQNHLILKKGYKSKLHFLTGDPIRFMCERSDIPIIGYLQAIGEDFIVVNDEHIPIKEIHTVVYKRTSFNFIAGGKMLQLAGPGLFAIAGINALLGSIRPIWSSSNLIASGSLLGIGLLLPKLQQKNYDIGNKFYLRIVPMDPELMKIKE